GELGGVVQRILDLDQVARGVVGVGGHRGREGTGSIGVRRGDLAQAAEGVVAIGGDVGPGVGRRQHVAGGVVGILRVVTERVVDQAQAVHAVVVVLGAVIVGVGDGAEVTRVVVLVGRDGLVGRPLRDGLRLQAAEGVIGEGGDAAQRVGDRLHLAVGEVG